MHRADGRRLDVREASAQLGADLRCAPARVLPLERQDQGLDLKRQAVRLPIRSAASIRQLFQAAVLVPREDLVAGLAGDIELQSRLGHLLALEQASHKPQALIHLGTLPPRHMGIPQMPESVTYVSGILCYPSARIGTNYLKEMVEREESIPPV